jgi:hypothetical protein
MGNENAGRSFFIIVEKWRDEMTPPSIMTILLTMAITEKDGHGKEKRAVKFHTVCREYMMITQVTQLSRTKWTWAS